MKKFFTLILCLTGALSGFAQSNFFRLGLGFNAGVTTAYTGFSYDNNSTAPKPDASKTLALNKAKYFGGSVDYFFTPYISAGLEYNMVELKDGPDQHERAFVSNFSSIEIRGSLAAGQFMEYSYNPVMYALRNVNVSLGVGVISGKNNVGEWDSLDEPRRRHENDIGKSKYSGVLSFPASIGYNFIFHNAYDEPFIQAGVNYKLVFTTSDDIDGYNDDPRIYNNKAKDIYTSLGITVKVLFGPRGLF